MGQETASGHKTNPFRRKLWTKITQLITLIIPSLLLRSLGYKTKASIQNWREKTTLCFFLVLLSGAFIFLSEILPRLLCYSSTPFTSHNLQNTSRVIIHGKVVDFGTSNTELSRFAKKYPGKDITSAFPRFSLLARYSGNLTYPSSAINNCIQDSKQGDAWLAAALKAPGYKVDNFQLVGCPDPINSSYSVPCFSSVKDLAQVKSHTIGGKCLI